MGVIAVQGTVSVSTVMQMALFAMTLPREAFDNYAVWFTAGMFLIGLGQAVGTERVIIGKRTQRGGTASAKVLGVCVGAAQIVTAMLLSSPVLAMASLAVAIYVAFDYQRFTRCFDEAGLFLRADVTVLVLQSAAVLSLFGVYGRNDWLVLVWWGVGLPAWAWLAGRDGTLREGVRVLIEDARDCLPLLVDAGLAGVPMVAALALAKAQGDVGVASEARMASTILGPIVVLNMSARRLIYQRRSRGPLSRRFAVAWAGICVGAFVSCVALLSLTRTPLYPWAFEGFVGLSWLAILGFAVGQTATFSTMLPAASLRAERRTLQIGTARVLATLAAVAAAWSLAPFTTPTDVAWCIAAAAVTYSAGLGVARVLTR